MGHALLFIRNEGVDDGFINGFQSVRLYLWTPYYMPAFFVITGYCSNFNKSFGTFLWQNFKTLKIPAIIFGFFLAVVTMINHHALSLSGVWHHLSVCIIESGLWFLDALFLAKILYWLLLRISSDGRAQLLLSLVTFLVGLLLYRANIPPKDFGNVCHALMLTLFLFAGQQLKEWQLVPIKRAIWMGMLFILALLVTALLGIKIPFITNKISLDWMGVLPFIVLSLSGSLMVIGASGLLERNYWLEYIGRNSLVFYMFNTFALNISVKLLSKYMTNHLLCVVLYLLVMLLTCAILVVITKILNTKYLRFTLGKF